MNWCRSSRRELALLQRKALIETKKSHIKMLKMALFYCAISEKCCSVVGGRGIPPFFRPHPGDMTAQESPPRGICYPRLKKKKKTLMLMPGGQPGEGLGAAGID